MEAVCWWATAKGGVGAVASLADFEQLFNLANNLEMGILWQMFDACLIKIAIRFNF